MKWTTIFVAAALMVITPCITHAADGKEKLQGKMLDVGMTNRTDYPVKAHLKKHYCMYDVNRNRNFDLAPGASATVRAESKASGGCFLAESYMVYEFTVAVPNISPIRIGECQIIKVKGSYGSDYKWSCNKQQVSDFYIEVSPPYPVMSINQRR